MRRFKVILEWDSEGKAYCVTVPSLPGCVTYGYTREEALERAQEAIEGFLETMKDMGLPLPEGDVEVVEVQVNYG